MSLNDFTIVYSYGGGEALFSVLNAVAMFFNEHGNSVFKGLSMFGLLWAGIQSAVRREHYKFYIKWFVTYMAVMLILWQPGSSGLKLRIHDVLRAEAYSVEGLPPGLVIPAGLISSLGYEMTRAFENFFTSPDYLPYHKYGTVFASQVASELRNFKIQDPIFRENMESYISNCMMYDVMLGKKYDITDLKTSTNILELIKSHASVLRMLTYRMKNKGGRELITCKAAIADLMSYFDAEPLFLAKKFPFFSKLISPIIRPDNLPAGSEILGALGAALSFYGHPETASQALRQLLIINAFKDKPASYGTLRAIQNQNTAWSFTVELSKIVLPVMHAIFEALVYGCFPIIIGFLFFTGAFRILGTYFGILIWLQLWPLLFAILNLVITVFSRRAGLHEELTINNITNIVDVQSSYAMAASSLGMLVPVLSYMIVKGGASQFVHIAGNLAGASMQGVAAATGEVTSGNRNLDNVSIGNTSLDNTNSHKYNIAPDSQGMHSRHELSDGTQKTDFIFGAKESITQSGPGLTQSSGPLNIGLAKELQKSSQKSYQEQEQHHQSESLALEKSQRATESHAVNFISRLAEGQSRGESYNFDTSTSEGQALEETISRAQDLHETHNYSWDQASRYALTGGGSASFGFGSPAAGLGGSANVGVDATGSFGSENSQSYSDSVSSNEAENLSHNLDTLYKSSKSMTYGETQSQEKDLGDTFSHSYETTQSKSHSLRESNDKMQALEMRKNFAESINFRNDINLYDEAFRYVEKLPDPVYKGYKLEQFQAQKIMNDMSPEGIQKRERLLEGFYERYMPKPTVPESLAARGTSLSNAKIENRVDDFKLETQGKEFSKVKESGPFEHSKIDSQKSFESQKKRAEETAQDVRMQTESVRSHLKDKVSQEEDNKGLMTKTFGMGQKNKNNELWDKGKK